VSTSSPHPLSAVVAALRAAGCVFAEAEAQLLVAAAHTPAELEAMVDQRVAGLPLEHLLGWAEFCGLRIVVDPGVFVPRRRTELLVQQAARLVRQARPRALPTDEPSRSVIVDLCCGSGAVGTALAAALGSIELHAADIDPVAVRCARRNVVPVGGRVYEGDLYDALPRALRGRIDILAVNAPYVPTDEISFMPPEARLYEATVALDGGADGLDVQRRIAHEAPRWLAPSGHLLVETSERQAPTTVDIFTRDGLATRVETSDDLDATVVIGTMRTDILLA
jgi:release factor glutamine methyltransferase